MAVLSGVIEDYYRKFGTHHFFLEDYLAVRDEAAGKGLTGDNLDKEIKKQLEERLKQLHVMFD